MDLVSLLIMFAGLYVASRFTKLDEKEEGSAFWKKPVVRLATFATTFRGGIMPLIDYGVIYHVLLPLVLRSILPEAYIAGLVPAFVLYNVIVPLYTVPIAYIVTKHTSKYLEIEPRFSLMANT